MVHYTGYITIPAHDTIQFWLAADDGGTIKIGLEEFGTWDDKGCSATESGYLNLEEQSLPLDAWFYENGGGTCFMLAWNINDAGWEMVPDEAFTNQAIPATSTTTTSTTTTSTTSTSTTTTTVAPVETTTTSTTSTSTTSTKPPQSSTTSTTTAPIIPTSTVQQIIATISTTTDAPSNVATTTSTPPPTPTPSSIQESTLTTTIARASATKAETIDPQVLELVTEIATLPAAEIQNKVNDIISSGINNAEAELLATSPVILENINKETATAIFEAITESNLTADQGQQIVNAVQNAPTTIRKAFEKAINVFGGATDTYVPIGSRVPISSRRIIIITTGLLVALPSPIRKKP
jgi:hypothetical protein